MDKALRDKVAEALDKPVAEVTDEDIAGAQEHAASIMKAAAADQERAAEVDADKVTRKDLDELAKQVTELGKEKDELAQQLADTQRPDIDPDESRIALDRVSRMKSMPEIARAVREPAQDESEKALKTVWDDLYTLSVVRGEIGNPVPVARLEYYRRLTESNPIMAKAIDTATTGEGVEWCPTEYSSELVEAIHKGLVVTSLFPRIEQPRDSFVLPFGLTGGTAYLQGESEADAPAEYERTTPTTASRTLTAKKLAALISYSEEAEEDSIVALLPELRKTISRVMGEAIEEAVISGDTATTHMDTNVVSSIDRRKAWNGLRDYCHNVTTTAKVDLSTYSGDTLLSIMTAMNQEYLEPLSDVVIIIPSKLRAATYTLVDNSTNKTAVFLRNTELGDRTLLSGQVGDFFGSPIVSSAWIPTNLAATGLYDGATTSTTVLLVVPRQTWLFADRRNVTIELVREPMKGRSNILSVWRGSFTHMYGTTDVTTGEGYNITP